MARLAVAAGVAGVLTAGAAPALASNSISKFSGNASGKAIAVQINPSTVLDVRLNRLQQLINSLDAVQPGVSGSVKNSLGSTLANPTAPIDVAVDAASAKAVSVDGTKLSDGAASSTAVAINARSLASEVALLNQAVHKMPSGTVGAVRTALGPIAAHNPTLAAALDSFQQFVADPVTGELGSPTIDMLRSVDASFGQRVTGDIATVEQGGLLTPRSQLALQPFEARALPSDAFATNAVDNLALVPSGQLGLAKANQIAQALRTIDEALIGLEKTANTTTGATNIAGQNVGSLTNPVTGTVFPIVNNQLGAVNTTVQGVPVGTLNSIIANLTSTLSGIDGLALNDIVGNNGANALSSVSRNGDVVTANGLGAVSHVDVVKINDARLQGILNTIAGNLSGEQGNALELASIDGIKASANVSLDGVHPATQSANGSLVDVKLLGRSLKSYVPAALGTVSLDQILPAGTSCTVNIPGTSTCHGIALQVPSTKALEDALAPAGVKVPTVLTVTLTRGLGVVDQTNSTQYGRADITVLQVTADLNCAAVSKVANAVKGTQSALASALDLHLAACGLGLTPAAPTATPEGNVHLVNGSFGVAHAELGLDTLRSTPDNFIPGPKAPETGSDLLIVAGLAVAAAGAGIGLQAWKARAARA